MLIVFAILLGTPSTSFLRSKVYTRKSSYVNARGILHIKYSICCPIRGTLSLEWGTPSLVRVPSCLDLAGVPPCLDLARVPVI